MMECRALDMSKTSFYEEKGYSSGNKVEV